MKTKTPDYNKLKKEWYKKLEESGFKDIEQDEDNLKSWSLSKALRNKNNGQGIETVVQKREAVESYYRLAGHFLHEHRFTSKLQKTIWEAHANGESIRDIVSLLATHGIKVTKNPVNLVIKELRAKMIALYTGLKNE